MHSRPNGDVGNFAHSKMEQRSFNAEIVCGGGSGGVFGLKRVTDAAHIYYGARLAYVDVQSSSVDESSFGLSIYSNTDQDGYRIGPTVGFEYLFGGHFSVGGEASYSFLDVDGESTSRIGNGLSQSTLKTEQKTNGTQTRLIFRYMF